MEEGAVIDLEVAGDVDALEVWLAGDEDEGGVGVEDVAEASGVDDEEVEEPQPERQLRRSTWY